MAETLITGATGYLGRHLVARLVEQGERPRCLVRAGARRDALPADRVEIVTGDITEPASLAPALRGAEVVIHLAAVVANIKESPTVSYRRINDEGTGNLVRAAQEVGARHFIHMGGINTVPGAPDSYIRTRYNGEQHVKGGGMPFTIVQPSILFGDGAAFFTALAGLVKVAPVVPVPGAGRLRFQPIWVEDVVTCLLRLLAGDGANETIPLGGPAYYTYDQLLNLICKTLHKRRVKLHMPLRLMTLSTAALQRLLPRPPATTAVLELFSAGMDNVATLDAVPRRFGFQPKALELELADHGI
jgi:NADH dehydrogenase